MNPVMTVKALRAYRLSYSRHGVLVVVRARWRRLVFEPEREYANAMGLADGVFS